ncbi:MAG: GNAT family N-acetyltransferase [Bdellovibrionota bacterium]
MNPKFQICKFELQFADECSALIRCSIQISHQNIYSNEEIDSITAQYSSEKLIVKSSNRKTFMITTEEKRVLAVGSAKGQYIKGIYVDPNHFSEGLGSAMLAFLENQIRQEGHSAAELFAGLNSETFYRHAGYEFVRHHNDPNGPAIVMRKKMT